MGDPFLVRADGNNMWYGNIVDVDVSYGIVSSMDEATITCEGVLGLLGRRNIRSLSLTQDLTEVQALDIISTAGLVGSNTATYSTAGAQTFTGNALDALNTLAITEVGRIREPVANGDPVMFYGRNSGAQQIEAIQFTDNNSTMSGMEFEAIDFKSTAENYYTRVTVSPLGLTAQTVNSGSAPYYSLSVSSWDATTAQAANLAQYLLSNFNTTTATPTSITASYAGQNSAVWADSFIEAITQPIQKQALIALRGTIYYTIIEGWNMSASPDNTTVTLYLSAQDLNAYLILDDSVYGKLNSNKLGF